MEFKVFLKVRMPTVIGLFEQETLEQLQNETVWKVYTRVAENAHTHAHFAIILNATDDKWNDIRKELSVTTLPVLSIARNFAAPKTFDLKINSTVSIPSLLQNATYWVVENCENLVVCFVSFRINLMSKSIDKWFSKRLTLRILMSMCKRVFLW